MEASCGQIDEILKNATITLGFEGPTFFFLRKAREERRQILLDGWPAKLILIVGEAPFYTLVPSGRHEKAQSDSELSDAMKRSAHELFRFIVDRGIQLNDTRVCFTYSWGPAVLEFQKNYDLIVNHRNFLRLRVARSTKKFEEILNNDPLKLLRLGEKKSVISPLRACDAEYTHSAWPYRTPTNITEFHHRISSGLTAGIYVEGDCEPWPKEIDYTQLPQEIDTIVFPYAKTKIILDIPKRELMRPLVVDGTELWLVAWGMYTDEGDLGSIYVLPQFRRFGLAKTIVSSLAIKVAAHQLSRGEALNLYAIIVLGNTHSERFFDTLGFDKSDLAIFFQCEVRATQIADHSNTFRVS